MLRRIKRTLGTADPRPQLVADAFGMDMPGWPADPNTHLALAKKLLLTDSVAFTGLLNRMDQLVLVG